jgi:class 3 adenylate cyclase/DNA-binding transcriptional MerR regulator
MTAGEFADLVGVPVETVQSYRSLGLLDPEDDGLLDDVDIMRVRVVQRYVTHLGFEPESLAAAIREGHIETPYGGQLFDTASPLSADDAAARAGLEPDQLRQLTAALGLPSSNLSEQDVNELFTVPRAALEAGLPWDAVLGVTRVLGDSIRRIAEAQIRAVHVYIHERLTAEGVSQEDVERQLIGMETLIPLTDILLQRLYRQYLVEALIEDAFLHLAEPERETAEFGSVEATIAFVDIASFTALAEVSGDDAAVRALDRIDTVVRRLLVEHDGKLVKQVGDGFMLAFRDPADAVQFAVATQTELALAPDLPAIRVGINTGPALYRTGDYLGGAVNVASRVVNSAMPGQILLTEPVATAATKAGIEVEELGVRMMRGVDEPLALYRVKPG